MCFVFPKFSAQCRSPTKIWTTGTVQVFYESKFGFHTLNSYGLREAKIFFQIFPFPTLGLIFACYDQLFQRLLRSSSWQLGYEIFWKSLFSRTLKSTFESASRYRRFSCHDFLVASPPDICSTCSDHRPSISLGFCECHMRVLCLKCN